MSLTASGSPCRGPGGASSAALSASSGSSRVTIAFTRGLTSAIRSRWLSTTSRAENSPARIPAASSVAVRPHMRGDSTSVRRMADFVHELRVRYGECDPQGIVFNPNYLAYFDHTVTELWRASAMGGWEAMVERGLDVVVGEANVRFRAPARFDDVIAIHARVAKLGTTSATLEMDVRRDGELLVEGWLRQVFVDAKTWRKTEIPDWAREALARFAGTGAGQPEART